MASKSKTPPDPRAATREIARKILAALAFGDESPLPIRAFFTGAGFDRAYDKAEVEKLVGQFCAEVVDLIADAKAQPERTAAAFTYLEYNTGKTQHLANAEEIEAGNMDSDGNWIRRTP